MNRLMRGSILCFLLGFSHFPARANNHALDVLAEVRGRSAVPLDADLREDILNVVMLRRTKAERADDLKLPPLTIRSEMIELTDVERDFYECIYKQTRSRFDTYVRKDTLLHNYAHIFDLLTRLRQAVDHPYLVIYNPKRELDEATSATVLGDGDDTNASRVPVVCGLCFDTAQDPITSACEHSFCRLCVFHCRMEAGCPLCRAPVKQPLRKVSSPSEITVISEVRGFGTPKLPRSRRSPKFGGSEPPSFRDHGDLRSSGVRNPRTSEIAANLFAMFWTAAILDQHDSKFRWSFRRKCNPKSPQAAATKNKDATRKKSGKWFVK